MKKIFYVLLSTIFIIMFTTVGFAGNFLQDSFGIKYDVGGGRYLENGWAWCDPAGTGIGYLYYFGPTGYILVNTVAPDGNIIDAAGRMLMNGVPATKIIERSGYELETASYLAYPSHSVEPSIPTQQSFPITHGMPLSGRLTSAYSATVTPFNYGIYTCPDAIEFTENSMAPYIMFNSETNTSLSFQLTGDNITDEADFVVEVYDNGVLTSRVNQRFVELLDYTITFAPYHNIEIRVPIINDYYERYIRRVYLVNAQFN